MPIPLVGVFRSPPWMHSPIVVSEFPTTQALPEGVTPKPHRRFGDLASSGGRRVRTGAMNLRWLAQTPVFWCLRSRRDVLFRSRTIESILSGALFFPIDLSLSSCACSGGERISPSLIWPCWREPCSAPAELHRNNWSRLRKPLRTLTTTMPVCFGR